MLCDKSQLTASSVFPHLRAPRVAFVAVTMHMASSDIPSGVRQVRHVQLLLDQCLRRNVCVRIFFRQHLAQDAYPPANAPAPGAHEGDAGIRKLLDTLRSTPQSSMPRRCEVSVPSLLQ